MEQFIFETKFYENYKTYDPNLMEKIKNLKSVEDAIYCLEELIKYKIKDNFLKYYLAELFQIFRYNVVIEKIKNLNDTLYEIVSAIDIYQFYDKFNGNYTIEDVFKFFNKDMIIEYNVGPMIRDYLREIFFDDLLCFLKQSKFDKSKNTYKKEYETHIFRNRHVLKFFIENDNYYFFYTGVETQNEMHIMLNPKLICKETYKDHIIDKKRFMFNCIIHDRYDIIQICDSLEFDQKDLNEVISDIFPSSLSIKIKYIEYLAQLYTKYDYELNTLIDCTDGFLLKFLKTNFFKSVNVFMGFLNEFKNKESILLSKENANIWDCIFSRHLKFDKDDTETRIDFLYFCQNCEYLDIYKKYETDLTVLEHIPKYTENLDLSININFLNDIEILRKYFDFEKFTKKLISDNYRNFDKRLIDYFRSVTPNIYDFKKDEDYYLNVYLLPFDFIEFLMEKNINFRKNNNEYIYSLLNKEKTHDIYKNRAKWLYDSIIIFFLKNVYWDVKIDLSLVDNDELDPVTIDYIKNHNEKL